ncbi:MAG: gliding motility-associated C-terminal domain-containing protein [Bacteroidota bacterium]
MKQLAVLLLLAFAIHLQAQHLVSPIFEGELGKRSIQKLNPCPGQDAGTIGSFDFDGTTAQSNDLDRDTLFMCLRDEILVNHAGDFALGIDPDPNTPNGVAYAVYLSRPTVAGPTLADIQADPAIVPNPLDPINRIVVVSNTAGSMNPEDVIFFNDGSIQNQLNSGQPIVLWFAPITVDAFTERNIGGVDLLVPTFEDDPTQDNDPIGPCVSVSLDEAFAVAYLNDIRANGITTDFENLSASFEVGGGLPQLDPTETYSISVVNRDDPTLSGNVPDGLVGHAQRVNVNVPQAGVYVVTVEDSKGCPLTFEVNITQGVQINITNLNIPEDGSGCVDVTVSNFTNVLGFQFPFEWQGLPIRFDSITNINPAISGFDENSFNIEDANFEDAELTTIWGDLTGSNPITLADGDVLFSICFTARGTTGECSTINVDFDRSLRPEVIDPNGMPYPLEITAGQVCISSDPFIVTVTKQDIACDNTAGFGSITFTPENGVAPYRFQLLDENEDVIADGDNIAEGETVVIDDLLAGEYDLVVFDQTSNDGSIEPFTAPDIAIVEGNNFGGNIEVDFVPISCNGVADGAIRVVITEDGVIVPDPGDEYSFLWNTGDTTMIVRDIGFGDYAVTVTNDGCSKEFRGSVSQPASISISEAQAGSQNATCPGINDGIIIVNVAGGTTEETSTYSYQWNLTGERTIDVGQPIQLGGLTSGTYTLTVTDENGCQDSSSFVVGNDKTLELSEITQDITCFGGNDGLLDITATTIGGSEELPYSFTWESNLNGSLPQDDAQSTRLDDLMAGTYILMVEDNTTSPGASPGARCFVRDTFTIIQPDRIQINADVDNATCEGGLNDGRVELDEPIGGTAPFTYSWDSFPDLSGRIAESLTTGVYTVVLTDANSCMDSITFNITAPDLPQILGIETDTLNCASDTDGQLTVDFQNGSSGAVVTSFAWSNGDSGESTDADLVPGEYIVTITDTNNCFAIDTGFVVAPAPLMLDSIVATRPSCPGFDDGEVVLFVSGGTAPYIYSRDGVPSPGSVFGGLVAGNYSFAITDINNCPAVSIDATVESAPEILVSFIDVTPTDCNQEQGTCTGAATATAVLSTGEERTFDFQWGNGEQNINTISSTAQALCEGVNTLRVTDDGNNGCTVEVEVEIASPPLIQPFAADVSFVSCNGANDGSVTVEVLGGMPDFQFLWDDNATGMTRTNLAPGVYSVRVIDANNCEAAALPIPIEEPAALELTIADATQSVTCAGDEDGFILLDVIGGNPLGGTPYTWSDGVAGVRDSLALDLSPGTYFATVVDVRGCTDSISYTIGEPTPVMATIPTPPEPACFGFQTSIVIQDASGGAGGPYSFSVNNLSKVTLAGSIPVFGGQEHVVSVFDIRGCSFDTTIFINQPPPVEVILPAEIEVQLGDSIRLRPDVFSVVPIDDSTIVWTPNDFLSTTRELNPIIRPFDSREYTLTLADINGCTGEATVFVDVDKKRNVYIPNVIAPNSIRNSRFEIQTGPGVRKVNFMRIYDRWGSLIYELDEAGPSIGGIGDWDGTFRGQKLPSATYVYIMEVEFEDNQTLLYRGDVTIVY